MIAKNKGDFLYNLHNELHRIGIDDDEEIFADFEEHFKASQEEGFTEEETCEKLGDVKEIARNYLDIQSTRINSIVAGALENQRRVSLTKPGGNSRHQGVHPRAYRRGDRSGFPENKPCKARSSRAGSAP